MHVASSRARATVTEDDGDNDDGVADGAWIVTRDVLPGPASAPLSEPVQLGGASSRRHSMPCTSSAWPLSESATPVGWPAVPQTFEVADKDVQPWSQTQ